MAGFMLFNTRPSMADLQCQTSKFYINVNVDRYVTAEFSMLMLSTIMERISTFFQAVMSGVTPLVRGL